ncbi:Rv2175c family DNA-binding protein [Georgenia faecalis]|uniref:Rv2175c family DNA-binding protein n=1 Tax=Georgenia faecalis TaxID=2483799 RepID=A0ABV9DB14_9MICO|nr:Rv2175c family DNA-binding protein [Georgenia faecalis]
MTDDDLSQNHWLSLPEVADALGLQLREVRAMVREQRLAGMRRGPSSAYLVPADFLSTDAADEAPGPLPALRGTLIQLSDAGYSEEDAVRWLLRPDEALGSTPIAALRAGQVHAVRRVAQALAF